MSETRAIKVESCNSCPSSIWKKCELIDDESKGPIPSSCPLPKWPSITEEEKKTLLNVIDMGISEYIPIAEYKCPGKILKEKLRSVINSLEVRDE